MNSIFKSVQRIFLNTQVANSVSIRTETKYGGTGHKVNNLEKKFLVWTGKYKTVDEVPAYVA